MELRHFRYFVAVAEELHFGRAAQRLEMSQPPLSQQIQQIEAELGVLLFKRSKRRVELTPAGEIFLEQARSVIVHIEEAIEITKRMGRGELGRLELGFVYSAGLTVLPPILGRFRKRFSQVELSLQELTTEQQLRALVNKQIQLGLVRPPIINKTASKYLSQEVIARESLVVALPQNHPLAQQERIALAELAEEPFINFPRRSGPGHYDQVMDFCRAAGFSPRVVQEAIQLQTIVSLVAVGLGIALVPASTQVLGREGVVYRELDLPTPQLELVMIWRSDDTSPVLQAFLEVARQVVST